MHSAWRSEGGYICLDCRWDGRLRRRCSCCCCLRLMLGCLGLLLLGHGVLLAYHAGYIPEHEIIVVIRDLAVHTGIKVHRAHFERCHGGRHEGGALRVRTPRDARRGFPRAPPPDVPARVTPSPAEARDAPVRARPGAREGKEGPRCWARRLTVPLEGRGGGAGGARARGVASKGARAHRN